MASRVAVGAGALAAVVVAGVGIHLAYLALNTAAVTALRLGGDGLEGALSAAAGLMVTVSAQRAWLRGNDKGLSPSQGDVVCG